MQPRGDLLRTVSVFLVNDDAMIAEFDAAGKAEHAIKYLTAQIPCQELELVIGMDYRAGVETKIGNANGRHVAIKSISKRVDGKRLVMAKKRYKNANGQPVP